MVVVPAARYVAICFKDAFLIKNNPQRPGAAARRKFPFGDPYIFSISAAVHIADRHLAEHNRTACSHFLRLPAYPFCKDKAGGYARQVKIGILLRLFLRRLCKRFQ